MSNGWELSGKSKVERLATHLKESKVTAVQVRGLLELENGGVNTSDFWWNAAARSGVNLPSRKARELVAEVLEGIERQEELRRGHEQVTMPKL